MSKRLCVVRCKRFTVEFDVNHGQQDFRQLCPYA